MKKMLVAFAALAAFVVLGASSAFAQVATENLKFIRYGNGTSVSVDVSNGFRDNTVADGSNHYSDTTAAVALYPHFYRNNNHGIANFPGSGTAADSVWFGTLIIEGTTATTDTVTITREVSPDGFTWTTADSLAGGGSTLVRAASVDVTYSPNITRTSLLWFAYPAMTTGGVTPRAGKDVNFVRFIVKSSLADLKASGKENGYRARFIYPVK